LKEPEEQKKTGPDLGDLEETPLTLPSKGSDIPAAQTGEEKSNTYAFTGDDFAKIKDANPGSLLRITYRAPGDVDYACGEIGWIDINTAGPIISGNKTGRDQIAYYDIEDVAGAIGTSDFKVHIFNGASLRDVTLFAAPDGYVPKKHEKASTAAGTIKIVMPQGHPISGKGDLSKLDYKKIMETAPAGGTIVFYFDDDIENQGVLKFGPKSAVPGTGSRGYKHYGLDADNALVTGDSGGWRTPNSEDKTVKFPVQKLRDARNKAQAEKVEPPLQDFNKFEINIGENLEGELLYIEIIPE